MNLKTRLALLYSLSVFIVLVASAVSIYVLNENFRKEEFIKRLVIEASESYQLFTDDDKIEYLDDQLDFNAQTSLQQEKIFIYDSALHLRYSSPGAKPINISPQIFEAARNKQHHDFTVNEDEAVILYGRQKNNYYYTIVTARDVFGKRKSENLRVLLFFSILGGLLLSGLLAFFYVRHIMQPLEELKEQIQKINEGNLTERISIRRHNDEVWEIAEKFNEMLERLEQAFEQRKNFVQHASHELRTPLANMLAHTESALNKDLTAEEYKVTLHSLKEDQQDLIDLTNSLLALSRYESVKSLTDFVSVRIDEVLYHTVDFIKQVWPKAAVSIEFETIPDDEQFMCVQGNESLIRSAIQNLVKNAIQYSENFKVMIWIDATEKGVTLKFDNTGKQILPEEQSRLFIPFFRGENSMFKKGYGLGLSIVQRIITLHKGRISYQALDNNTNRFIVFLPAN
jgi:signal transduction histidine kinase